MFTIQEKTTKNIARDKGKEKKIVIYMYREITDLVETLTLKINIHLYKEQEERNQVRVIIIVFYFSYI
jgi:hypothetical protein